MAASSWSGRVLFGVEVNTTAASAFGHGRAQRLSEVEISLAFTSDTDIISSIKKLIELSDRRRLAKYPADARVDRTGISVFRGVQGAGVARDWETKPKRPNNIPTFRTHRITHPESF